MADDLVNRLRAALDRAEQQARDATPGQWVREWAFSTHFVTPDAAPDTASGNVSRLKPSQRADAEHIAAWDPSRVLRLIARDRAMLDRHAPNLDGLCHGYVWPCRDVLAAADFWLEGDRG